MMRNGQNNAQYEANLLVKPLPFFRCLWLRLKVASIILMATISANTFILRGTRHVVVDVGRNRQVRAMVSVRSASPTASAVAPTLPPVTVTCVRSPQLSLTCRPLLVLRHQCSSRLVGCGTLNVHHGGDPERLITLSHRGSPKHQ